MGAALTEMHAANRVAITTSRGEENMFKYELLTKRLEEPGPQRVSLSVTEIDDLVGGLPRLAFQQGGAWWDNDPSHPQGRAWLDAGYEVKNVDLAGGVVTFGRR